MTPREALLSAMLSDQLRAPISQDAPCGSDVRYDDDFAWIKAEIGKQSTVASRTDFDRLVHKGSALLTGKPGSDGASTLVAEESGLDYAALVDTATRILTSKSKDLEVAAYLCLGLFRVRGYEGLAEGLEGYQALIEGYWENAFPELRRLEGRRRVVQWLAQRLADTVPLLPPGVEERDALERCMAACRAIDLLLIERVVENPPSLSALLRALAELKDALPAAASVAPAAASPPAGAAAPAAPAPAVPSPGPAPAASAAGLASEQEAVLAVTRAADFLRIKTPQSPVGYRLLRSVRWDDLTLPALSEDGKTLVAPPEPHFRIRLESARAAGAWLELVGACEELFYEPANAYWLDLQRFEDQALGALGTEWASVRRLLRHEVARLLERLPSLVGLSFADGEPFADAATREWIERDVLQAAAQGPRAAGTGGAAQDEELERELAAAEERAEGGDLAGALEALQTSRSTDGRPRPRFQRQLLMARLCLAHAKPAVARSLLEELDGLSEHASLWEWEPELCYRIWSLLHRSYQELERSSPSPVKEEYQARMDRVFDKICRLDVRLAVSEGGRTSP